MKRIISLVLTFCLLAIPLLGLAEEHVAQTTPAVHRQDYDYSGVDTSKAPPAWDPTPASR